MTTRVVIQVPEEEQTAVGVAVVNLPADAATEVSVGPMSRVKPGERRDFHVWDSQCLWISEDDGN